MKFKKILELKSMFMWQILPVLIMGLGAYTLAVFQNQLPNQVPFFYTLPWGINQLADKSYLWWMWGFGVFILIVNATLAGREYLKGNFHLANLYNIASISLIILLNLYLFRIIHISAITPLIIPVWIKLILLPYCASVLSTVIIVPLVIKFAKKFGFIDDPLRHNHPGMLLTKPIPRAGGLAFFLGILLPGLLFLPIAQSQRLVGIFIGAAICVLAGLRDDKKDVNPYIRLTLQIITVLVVALSGIILIYIPNPFGEAIKLDDWFFSIDLLGETRNVHYVSVIAAMLWMGITMNFMSFANGTDGVYAGLITIAALFISILMLSSLSEDPGIAIFIKLAALTSGAALGMAFFTWPPQKLLWGYGATSAGLIIAALSIIGSTKVAVTLIVLAIPFLDGAFAFIRRIRRGQMPLWGDREHLHHKLLEGLGWSKQKVAAFYWLTTLVLGSIGLLTSGQSRALSLASIAILIIFGVAALNFIKRPGKENPS